MTDFYILIAKSAKDASRWAVEHGLHHIPKVKHGWLYAGSAYSVSGFPKGKIVLVPGYKEKHMLQEVLEILEEEGHTYYAETMEQSNSEGSI